MLTPGVGYMSYMTLIQTQKLEITCLTKHHFLIILLIPFICIAILLKYFFSKLYACSGHRQPPAVTSGHQRSPAVSGSVILPPRRGPLALLSVIPAGLQLQPPPPPQEHSGPTISNADHYS